ncbi:MAG: helix-turn-helix domain-containing protein [Bdellovibrionota bacterium]|mgnify:CR=1 FL=1
MGRKMFIVSDDNDFVVAARAFCEAKGGTCRVLSTADWSRQMNQPGFVHTLTGDMPLVAGSEPVEGAKILQFPGGHASQTTDSKVHTINELEAVAIQNAIHNFDGNLTEAARALGIGRATLYRKVKQYNIDPSMARRSKKAA